MLEQFVGLMASDCRSRWCPVLAIARTCLLCHTEQECQMTKNERDNTYGLQIINGGSASDLCEIKKEEDPIVLQTFAAHDTVSGEKNIRYCYVECKIGWYRLAGHTPLKLTCIPKGENHTYGQLNAEDIKCAGARFVLRGGLYVSCSFGCEVCHFCAHHTIICTQRVQRKRAP